MNCPVCQHPDNFVVRTDAEADEIKRRRECERCHHRWNTFETSEDVAEKLQQIKTALAPVAELVK